MHQPDGIRAKRLLLVGAGSYEQVTRASWHAAVATAVRSVTGRRWDRVAVAVPADVPLSIESLALATTGGVAQGSAGPGLRKKEPGRFAPQDVVLVTEPAAPALPPAAVARGAAEADAVTFARELVNLPPSDIFPESFAARAGACGKAVSCEIWDETRLVSERMGAVLAVARGSVRPPRFVVLRYMNGGASPTLALVGKGVTFDSGGLSLKTTDQMADMKGDMAGGAAVLATMKAVAELKPEVNVVGYIPLVENMPGGRAMKLGDVVTARNGKTIEVLNTDAEGRLILADALAYAAEAKPGHLVDVATLTGACMVALGTQIAGLMGNNAEWTERVRVAVARAGSGRGRCRWTRTSRTWSRVRWPTSRTRRKRGTAGPSPPASSWSSSSADCRGSTWTSPGRRGPTTTPRPATPGGPGAFVHTLIELVLTYRAPP